MSDSFSSLGLSNWLTTALKRLGIRNPSSIQCQTIPLILSPKRNDVFACSRTGSGKTLAYLLPIIELLVRDPKPYFALILSPTRELANQINEMITALTVGTHAVKSLLIIGGQDREEAQGLWFGKPNIIVCTPGRILDQFTNRNYLDICGQKRSLKFDFVVLDEADQLISSGFCQQMKDILTFLDHISSDSKHKRQTLLFSATLTSALEQLQELISQKSEKPVIVNLLPTVDEVKVEMATNPDLDQRYILCPESIKVVYLVECILDLSFRQLIIFCATKKEAKLIHKVLLSLGFDGPDFNLNPVILNADMKQSLRFASLEKFRSLKSKILVTTDLANRGLDLPQVDLIINYNCPKSAIVYVHRVGRTCRKPDFKYQSIDMPNDQNLSIDEEVNQQINDTKSIKKSKKDNNNKFKLKKKSQNCLSSKYLGKSITFVTQYDINLFKSIENFIGIKMDKEVIDEKSVTTIIKQVSVAIKDAEIRIEHEEQESKHIENKNRDKHNFKNKKIKTK
jgi:superfamily II DNA/RNA helicase